MKKILLLVSSGLLVIGIFSFLCVREAPRLARTTKTAVLSQHISRQDDPEFYNQAYMLGGQYKKQGSSYVHGGIVPHHLLAAPLIAGFFASIADQDITTVILLGPNHFLNGPYTISTSEAVWKTLYGTLPTDSERVAQLVHNRTAYVYEDVFENEHAIYGIAPFIKRTFPDATFVPLVIKGSITKGECDKLVSSLEKLVDEHTLIVASVDFSHYLPSADADRYDAESIAKLTHLSSDVFSLHPTHNADSPASLYMLLELMRKEGFTRTEVVAHTNSAKLTQQPDLTSTTSYVTMTFSD